MKLYFAGAESDLDRLKRHKVPNVLVSYNAIKDWNNDIDNGWFLDSGAYSAFTLGIEIDIYKFIDFIQYHQFSIYAGLDVIGDAEASYKNINIMLNAELKPIPTFHFNEDFSFLHGYLDTFDYIAIGGVAQLSKNLERLVEFLDICWAVIWKYWPKKIHGFAISQQSLLERYPFYSVDSTTWQQGARFGSYTTFRGRNFTRRKNMGELLKTGCKDVPIDFILFTKSRDYRIRNGIMAMLEYEDYITRLWERRGVVWDEDSRPGSEMGEYRQC